MSMTVLREIKATSLPIEKDDKAIDFTVWYTGPFWLKKKHSTIHVKRKVFEMTTVFHAVISVQMQINAWMK